MKIKFSLFMIFRIVLILLPSCRALREIPPDTSPERLQEQAQPLRQNSEYQIKQSQKFICSTIKATFILIPAGEFIMGNNNSFDDEKPEHKIIISKKFWVAETETSIEQYEIITGKKNDIISSNSKLPVVYVSWNDAVNFCNILTEIEKLNLPNGYVYRLPTEAEWEYMCKSGQISLKEIDQHAWHNGNKGTDRHLIKQKLPDKNGIYDTLGNVLEWCLDSTEMNEYGLSTGTYKNEKQTDPLSRIGKFRVCRGGSWCYDENQCNPTRRYADEADFSSGDLGFRIVLAPKLE